jgi:hypothetical protein
VVGDAIFNTPPPFTCGNLSHNLYSCREYLFDIAYFQSVNQLIPVDFLEVCVFQSLVFCLTCCWSFIVVISITVASVFRLFTAPTDFFVVLKFFRMWTNMATTGIISSSRSSNTRVCGVVLLQCIPPMYHTVTCPSSSHTRECGVVALQCIPPMYHTVTCSSRSSHTRECGVVALKCIPQMYHTVTCSSGSSKTRECGVVALQCIPPNVSRCDLL